MFIGGRGCPDVPASSRSLREAISVKIRRTRGGFRISQHGVVISEGRNRPGPTHSVFDVLSALMVILSGEGRVGMLGFAGGGMMAPLRQLGFQRSVEAVDLDEGGYNVFRKHCSRWAGSCSWHRGDAVEWLEAQRSEFGVIVEDLSVSTGSDVFKPAVCWSLLPELVRSRLLPGGVAIFNLLPGPDGRYPGALFGMGILGVQPVRVEFEDYFNRILIVGERLPSARSIGARLRAKLSELGSKQAGRIHVASGPGEL